MITIDCPSCRRHLQLPASLQGETVRCPGCRETFTATPALTTRRRRDEEIIPPPPPRPETAERSQRSPRESLGRAAEEGTCPACGETVDPQAPRCASCGERMNRQGRGAPPPWQRRDCEPHRGGVIQFCGIVGLVFGCLAIGLCGITAVFGLPLGIAALVMSSRDIPKMERGEMDPGGLAQSRNGRQCALLAVIFSLLCGGGFGLLGLYALIN